VRFSEADGTGGAGEESAAECWSERVHLTTARAVCEFRNEPLANAPAVSVRASGAGRAYYVATRLAATGHSALIDRLLTEAGVSGVLATPPGVEACERRSDARRWLFLINHGDQAQTVELAPEGVHVIGSANAGRSVVLGPRGVAVIDIAGAEGSGALRAVPRTPAGNAMALGSGSSSEQR